MSSSGLRIFHLAEVFRPESFQKFFCRDAFKRAVCRFDAKEESIAGGQSKSRLIEYGMMGHRKPIQCQHAENADQCGGENGAFKGNRNECRPAVQRPATNV